MDWDELERDGWEFARERGIKLQSAYEAMMLGFAKFAVESIEEEEQCPRS